MNSDSQNVKVKARIRIGKQYPELKLVEVPAAVLSRERERERVYLPNKQTN